MPFQVLDNIQVELRCQYNEDIPALIVQILNLHFKNTQGKGKVCMAAYNTFCPIAKAATVLGERWTILILRELMYGSTRFNRLERGITGISRAILAKRLRTLVHYGIVSTETDWDDEPGYFLTERGTELLPLVSEIGRWGQRWLNHETRREDIDTEHLIWDMHRRLDLNALPERLFVAEVNFHGLSSNTYWLVIHLGRADVSLDPPGVKNDLLIDADAQTLHDDWLGRKELNRALNHGEIRLHGPPEKSSAFVQSLQLSPFATISPAA